MKPPAIILFFALFLLGVFLLLVTPRAGASDKWPVWSDESSLDFGRCLRSERDSFDANEYAAIGHALVKLWRNQQQGRTWHEQIHATCAMFKKTGAKYDGTRPDRIRRSTWVDPLHRPVSDPDWVNLRRFVTRFQKREVPDPCRRAWFWGAAYDVPKRRAVVEVVDCGDTANTFYGYKQQR